MRSATRFVVVLFLSSLLLGAAAWSGYLMWRLLHKTGFETEYTGWGEILLVFVIAVEGLIATFELAHNQRSAKAAANAAVFEQHKLYLSIDYHENVRRPAGQALLLARRSPTYRLRLLQGLAGELVGDEATRYLESERNQTRPTVTEREDFALHNAYHRVQDIFGFFTTLALLKADHDVLELCNFFYDRWRGPLHRIVDDLGKYTPSDEVLVELKTRRHSAYQRTLTELDKRFKLSKVEWDEPQFKNVLTE